MAYISDDGAMRLYIVGDHGGAIESYFFLILLTM